MYRCYVKFLDNNFILRGVKFDMGSGLYITQDFTKMLAHADYFSEIHSTVRVYDNCIQFQNAGGFPVNLDIVGKAIVSQPRNPNILRFFKLAKISENGGYGIDKILNWKNLTGCDVTINSEITKSEVDFSLPINVNQRQSTSDDVNDVEKTLEEQVLTLIRSNNKISISELALGTKQSKSSIDRAIATLKNQGLLGRIGTPRNGRWILKD